MGAAFGGFPIPLLRQQLPTLDDDCRYQPEAQVLYSWHSCGLEVREESLPLHTMEDVHRTSAVDTSGTYMFRPFSGLRICGSVLPSVSRLPFRASSSCPLSPFPLGRSLLVACPCGLPGPVSTAEVTRAVGRETMR